MKSATDKPVLTPTRGALALAILAATAPTMAAEWELNPRIEAGVVYDDNYRLTRPGTEIDVTGPMADVAFELRALMPTSEFSITPRVRATYFPDSSDLDSVDYFTSLNWQHRGQRVNSRLRGEISQQDIVTAEQPDAQDGGDLGDPDFGDSGRTLVDNRRLLAELRPSFDFDLSERRLLTLEAGYTDVRFDDQIAGSQVDFSISSISGGWVTRFSPTHSFTVRLRGTRFDIDTRDSAAGYGAEVQWDKRTREDTRWYLRLGGQSVETQFGDQENAWLAGAGTNWILGRNELFLDASRNVGPSSSGFLVTRDQLRLRWTRAITPRLSLLAGLRGTHDQDFEDTPLSTFGERTYASSDVGVQWRWQEEFSLRAQYDYTWQEFADAAQASKSSGLMVSILYQPLQRRR
jgi:hypothetical protein